MRNFVIVSISISIIALFLYALPAHADIVTQPACPDEVGLAWYETGYSLSFDRYIDIPAKSITLTLVCTHFGGEVSTYTVQTDSNGYYDLTTPINTNEVCPADWNPLAWVLCPAVRNIHFGLALDPPVRIYLPIQIK